MKHLYLIILAVMALSAATAMADDNRTYVSPTTNVTDLEDDIRYQEDLMAEKQDSIDELNAQIQALKQRLDSINALEKDVKGQISALEKMRKALENDIKVADKTRRNVHETRDYLVFDQEIQDVLLNPYNKLDVENALRSFEGMETKEVLKKRELLENYGRYTIDMRKFLEKQRSVFANLRWATQGADSDAYKKFDKGLKSLSYYKVYEKGMKNQKNATIPYLDKVINAILQLERRGFNSAQDYDKVLDMLYTND
ncbi:MAG: hypothetical protein IKQ89_05235 [Muribaculaceae bacterium]|nr:hypothetical protein [Muribaculaceae bacterium]